MSKTTHHWQSRWLLAGCLMCSGLAYAEAIPTVLPGIEQQLLDARKQVLDAETQLVEEKIRNQQREHQLFLEKEQQVLSYTAVGSFLGLMLGLFGGWGFMFWKARDWVSSRVEQEINNNIRHLSLMVDKGRLETRLKDEKRILVLYGKQCSNLDSLLRRFGFLHTDALPCPSSPDNVKWGEWDEIIFDNVDADLLKSYLGSGRKSWYLAYKTGDPYPGSLTHGATLTLANNQVTLYPRLMELLIWRRMQEPTS